VQCQFALLCRSAWILKCVYQTLVRQHTRKSFRVNKKTCVRVRAWLRERLVKHLVVCESLVFATRPGLSHDERYLVHMLFGLLASANVATELYWHAVRGR
jgi:hypothetical protein